MLYKLLAAALYCLVCSCAGTPVLTHGIPHLLQVEGHPNAYRMGQPPDEASVLYLAEILHVKKIYKLDSWDEGDADRWAPKYGIEIIYLPIPPSTKPDSLDDYVDELTGPDAKQWQALADAARFVRDHPEVVVAGHCVNGNDRTGAWSGLIILPDHTIDEAHAYMVSTGFHDALLGLRDGWFRTARKIKGVDGLQHHSK
jgi:hypothetical protein